MDRDRVVTATFGAVVAVASVVVAPPAASVAAGSMTALTATVKDAGGNTLTDRTVTWSSNNTSVATVAQDGTVSGVAAGGPVTITATSEGVSGTAQVTVTLPFFAATQVALSYDHACALAVGGGTFCWGTDMSGDLGLGGPPTGERRVNPIVGGLSLTSIAVGVSASCGLVAAGDAYCWGSNFFGELGDGTQTSKSSPTAVTGGVKFDKLFMGGSPGGRGSSGGSGITCGLSRSTPYCWGWDPSALPDSPNNSPVPAVVAGSHQFATMSVGARDICGIDLDGVAFCWGVGGSLGDGTTTTRTVPTQVSAAQRFVAISAGFIHTCALTTAGAAYCWGSNFWGQLGDGTNTDALVPVAVAGGLTFASIVAGVQNTCALTADGIAYCWGQNSQAQIGDGTQTDRSTPTLVSGGHHFTSLTTGAFAASVCGVEVSTIVYCWGANTHGEIGMNGGTALVPTPIPIP
jgi:alpha-tubulin suppressor-like RCC1 family protein